MFSVTWFTSHSSQNPTLEPTIALPGQPFFLTTPLNQARLSLSIASILSKIALTFDKGENVFVEGTIEQREFTPKDGSKRVVSEVIVRHCHLIAPARAAAASTTAQRGDPQQVDSVPNLDKAPNHDEDWPVG